MTREELRIKFSEEVSKSSYTICHDNLIDGCELSDDGLYHLTNIVETIVEPLFEKIEYLSNEITNDSMTLALQESIWFGKVEKLKKEIERLTNLLDDSEAKDVRIHQLEERIRGYTASIEHLSSYT